MTQDQSNKIWAIVPAAGIGKRMSIGASNDAPNGISSATLASPKQYLSLCGKTIIEHSVERLLSVPQIKGVLVCVSQSDEHWQSLDISKNDSVISVHGGKERMHSVYNALNYLQKNILKSEEPNVNNQFVLVHDAVRPCVLVSDIENLIKKISNDKVGGLLATPAVDTLKRVDSDCRVIETLPRDECWRAQTPQMFKIELLKKSIELLLSQNKVASDEAGAIEAAGFQAKVVEGAQENIKLTLPSDLPLLEAILSSQLNQIKG